MDQDQEIINQLKQHSGTQHYFKFNTGENVLTDGMNDFRKLCKCDWLLTDIDAYFLTNHKDISKGNNTFWLVSIKVDQDKKAVMTIKEDIGIKPIVSQKYEYTDFPLSEFEFYIIKQNNFWVYLLKNEY